MQPIQSGPAVRAATRPRPILDSALIVGSPPSQSPEPSPRARHLYTSAGQPPTIPESPDRTPRGSIHEFEPTQARQALRITTPPLPPRRSPSTPLKKMTDELRRMPRGAQEAEWTVFEGVMAHEAQAAERERVARRTPVRSQSFTSQATLESMYSTRATSPEHDPSVAHDTYHGQPEEDEQEGTEEEEEGETTEGLEEAHSADAKGGASFWRHWRVPTLTPLQRNILKCSIAYLIASLFTYSDTLSSFVALFSTAEGPDGEKHPSPSGHMVATMCVCMRPSEPKYMTEASLARSTSIRLKLQVVCSKPTRTASTRSRSLRSYRSAA
jgi:hypothetical protein